MGPDEITPGWLTEVLGGEVGGVVHERIGDGLVGLNLRVTLLDRDPELPGSVVCKLPSPDPTSRATGIALRTYEREVKFYRHVAHTVDVRMPRCHHADWNAESGDFVLVLEDMAPAVQGDQIAGCDHATATASVAELAKLHGPRWGDATLHDLDWLSRREGPRTDAELVGLWSMFFPGFAATYRSYLSDEASALVERFGQALGAWVSGRAPPTAVTHGDYRLDNLLFGTADGGPPVTVVDWQTPGHGSPVGDLAYFLGAGLVPEDRRVHERELLGVYADGIRGYGVDLDEGWLWEQYRRESFAGVVMAVIASQVVGANERSEAMFAAMATRHLQHALDLDALALV